MSERPETRDEIMARYAAGIQAVEDALAGLAEADLDLARAENKWTIRQIVHHIADAELLWEVAIKSALGNCGCLFDASWYIIGNGWADPLQYATRPADGAFGLYKAIRQQILELLEYVPDPWEKYVLFHWANPDEARRWTVGEIVTWQARHALIHVEQILETREVHGR
jgi:uncharacterized damage-inducible protein DinB